MRMNACEFGLSSWSANRLTPSPSKRPVGTAAPENVPLVASMVGFAALGFRVVPSPPMVANVTGPAGVPWFVAARRGVTFFVTRGDSSEVGPDLMRSEERRVGKEGE